MPLPHWLKLLVDPPNNKGVDLGVEQNNFLVEVEGHDNGIGGGSILTSDSIGFGSFLALGILTS